MYTGQSKHLKKIKTLYVFRRMSRINLTPPTKTFSMLGFHSFTGVLAEFTILNQTTTSNESTPPCMKLTETDAFTNNAWSASDKNNSSTN